MRPEKKQTRSFGETKSWESEVWDTSLAIRAVLLANVELQESLIPAIRWLLGLRDKSGNKTWHDEPWETAHALFAIFDARKDPVQFRRACGSIEVDEEDLRDTVHWYIGLQDPKGKAITPHYTAFLLLILENALLQFTNQQQLPHYKKSIHKATYYVISALRDSPAERLWTSEAWSNGYIRQSLCRSHTFEKLHSNPKLIRSIQDGYIIHVSEKSKKVIKWALRIIGALSAISGAIAFFEYVV